MKVNKRFITLNLLACLLLSQGVWAARIQGQRSQQDSGSSAGSTGRQERTTEQRGTKVTDEGSRQVTAAAESSCNKDMDAEEYFPAELFKDLSRDGEGLQVELRPGNKIAVKIPPVVNFCGSFVPVLRQAEKSKNIIIMMKLVDKDNKNMSHGQLAECLQKASVKKDGTDFKPVAEKSDERKSVYDPKFNHDLVPGKYYTESTYLLSYDFDKKKDVKETISVSMGFPSAYNSKDGYNPISEFESKSGSFPGVTCMLTETIPTAGSKKLFVNKGRDVLIEEINDICRNGNAQDVAAARDSLGNADALSDIADKIRSSLDAEYLKKAKVEAKAIYEKMGKIEERLAGDLEKMDQKKAKKDVDTYAELAKELDSLYINKAINRIDNLLVQREKLDSDSEEIKKIDQEIEALNEEIGAFSRRSSGFANVYGVMEKFAFTDQAKVIEDIRKKSEVFSRVYEGDEDKRGPKLTLETANKEQAEHMQRVGRVMVDWFDVHQASKGSMYPIKKTEKEIQAVATRMNSRMAALEKKDREDYNNYCTYGWTGGQKNPVKCREWSTTRQVKINAELKRREKDLLYIRGRSQKLDKMGNSYNLHMRSVASREVADAGKYDPFASSFSGIEDTFQERYPQYYGSQVSTAYDPMMYQMGGMQQSMMMGQQQMMMPGAQQQMMPGQNQLQMGGWPSLP
jgi:hypothetical protein